VAEVDSRWEEFFHGLVRVRADRLDLRRGIRCGLVVLIPVVVGYFTGLVEAGVLVTMGALNLFFVEPARPGRIESRLLIAAVFVNAAGFGAGTLVALLPRLSEAPLVAVGVAAALLPSVSPRWQGVSFIAAVMFVLPLGIPPTTLLGVALRPLAILIGGAVALIVVLFERTVPLPRAVPAPLCGPSETSMPAVDWRAMSVHAAVVGVTAAVGLLIGFELRLPRDYWVLLTVVVALRIDLASTLSLSTARILGTVAGATVAFGVTLFAPSPWILFPVLAAVTGLAFASRGVNYIVYALWVTITIIVLLSLAYAGGPSLAVVRVEDTVIGGALALVASFLLWALVHEGRRPREVRTDRPARAADVR
jgi:uncharacterized membrane protein YccC